MLDRLSARQMSRKLVRISTPAIKGKRGKHILRLFLVLYTTLPSTNVQPDL